MKNNRTENFSRRGINWAGIYFFKTLYVTYI